MVVGFYIRLARPTFMLERANAITLHPDGKIIAGGTAGMELKDALNGDFEIARHK